MLPEPVAEGCIAFDNLKVNHTYLTKGRQAAIHVYVTDDGYPEFKRREGVFPVDTIILKEKFSDNATKVPELYTGMIKREKGYNPKLGDWEFFTANGDATAIISRGRIDSCMDCHQQYAASDFVTKRYVDGQYPNERDKIRFPIKSGNSFK